MEDSVYLQHLSMEADHWWFKSRFIIIEKIIDMISPQRDHNLIDVGCGTGGMVAHLSKQYNCIGIDNSELAIKIAKKSYPNLIFYRNEAEEVLPKLSNDKKIILLLDVLEHIKQEKNFFHTLFNTLLTGDQILLTVPANPSLWSKHDVSAGHYRRYCRKTLEALWQESNNIRVRLFSYYNSRLYPVIKIIRSTCKVLKISSGLDSTDFRKTPYLLNRLLTYIFSGEAKKLLSTIDQSKQMIYKKGVSLIVLLEKT